MKLESVELKLLKPFERNIRIHPEMQIKELARSVEKYGQTRPIVVDENNTIMIGNGLYESLKLLNRDTASVYRVVGLSEKEKTKLMLSDNKIYELGLTSHDALIENLTFLEGDFDVPGFDSDVLKDLFIEPDDLRDKVNDYGTVSDVDKANVGTNNPHPDDTSLRPSVVELSNDKIKIDDSSGESKPYVVCECGKKVWL